MMTKPYMDGEELILIISLPTFRTHSQKTLRLSLKKIIDQLNVFLMELGLLFQIIKTELKRSWKQQEEKEKRFH